MNLYYAEYQKSLKELHDEIRKVIAGLTPEALNWKPGKDTNSIAVMVVLLVGAERYWLGDPEDFRYFPIREYRKSRDVD